MSVSHAVIIDYVVGIPLAGYIRVKTHLEEQTSNLLLSMQGLPIYGLAAIYCARMPLIVHDMDTYKVESMTSMKCSSTLHAHVLFEIDQIHR